MVSYNYIWAIECLQETWKDTRGHMECLKYTSVPDRVLVSNLFERLHHTNIFKMNP